MICFSDLPDRSFGKDNSSNSLCLLMVIGFYLHLFLKSAISFAKSAFALSFQALVSFSILDFDAFEDKVFGGFVAEIVCSGFLKLLVNPQTFTLMVFPEDKVP